jgi:hypothetical protein
MTAKTTVEGLQAPVSAVETVIRGYLERCPHASDTIDGIRRYWLPKQREWLLREAVCRLVKQGETRVETDEVGAEYVAAVGLAR